jgi:hypothetical protein
VPEAAAVPGEAIPMDQTSIGVIAFPEDVQAAVAAQGRGLHSSAFWLVVNTFRATLFVVPLDFGDKNGSG